MGSFTVARGEVLGPASPLAPFHMNALGDMWTSTTVRNWTLFGYTYPELANDPSNSTLTSSINRLYKPQTQGLGNSNSTVPAPPGHNSTTNGTAQATDWLCEVHMPTDIKISYSVRAFLGKPSSNPKNWATDANYVGQLASMSSPRMNSSVITSGSIALTEKLAQKHASGELASLDKQTVKAYLKENFTWRIQALDYSEISRKNPPKGLNVTVFNVPVSIPTEDDEVPTWTGDVEYEHDIEGNPPSDDDTAASAGGESGVYNAEAGEFEWKKAPDNGPPPPPASGPAVVTEVVEVVATEYVTVGAEATSTAEKEVSTTLSEAEKAPETTAPVDPKTAWVTSVVLEYVTV
jgi:tyrosinase